MAKGYIALRRESEDDLLPKENGGHCERRPSRSRRTLYLSVFLAISLLANVIVLGIWGGIHKRFNRPEAPSSYGEFESLAIAGKHADLRPAKPLELPTVYKQFHWNTQWSSINTTLQDRLWDGILPSHGFVAIDRTEATDEDYPESMYLPGDKSKGVYLLEAYHQLHCLKILHTTMRESLTGSEFTWTPGSHLEHCFDYLIQITMCNADTTPLYTFGDNTAGDGQTHKCKDWNTLREYATENTACYRDTVEDVLLGQHFGYCDDGYDGMEEPRRVERVVDSN